MLTSQMHSREQHVSMSVRRMCTKSGSTQGAARLMMKPNCSSNATLHRR